MGRPPKEVFLGLDMPFSEALERYSKVDPKEVEANIAKEKKKKPPGKKAPGGSTKAKVVLLGDHKAARKRRGLA